MENLTVPAIIAVASLVSLALGISSFFIGRASARRAEGEKAGAIASDIGYIKAGNDDIKKELRDMRDDQTEIKMRLGVLEEKSKSQQRQIDEIKKGG
ncbi:MAG: hypothetical protein IK132_12215 [Clostridia bacterium]|jgi:uncharacterized protein HemX|nr:hypothetical protein [Clostridia bacterium]